LYGTQVYIQNFADLFIGKLMKVRQEQYFPQMIRHSGDGVMDELLKLAFFHRLAGQFRRRLHQVDKLTAFVVAGADGRLKRVGRPARLRTDEVARLVGGDSEKPGAEAALRIKLLRRLMYLQECFLEDVFGTGEIAEESNKKMIEFTLISANQQSEGGAIAMA